MLSLHVAFLSTNAKNERQGQALSKHQLHWVVLVCQHPSKLGMMSRGPYVLACSKYYFVKKICTRCLFQQDGAKSAGFLCSFCFHCTGCKCAWPLGLVRVFSSVSLSCRLPSGSGALDPLWQTRQGQGGAVPHGV